MCRWVVYIGQPIFMSEVITKPRHSIVSQATDHYLPELFASIKKVSIKIVLQELRANHLINGDGFGIGWYIFDFSPVPCVFSSVTPPWNNRNLTRICDQLKSPLFFGHVRAATAGTVTEVNCHPFQLGRYMFMHNGGIPEFYKFKARFLASLCDSMVGNIKGTTDTEHCFVHILNGLPNADVMKQVDLEVLIWALLRTIRFIMDTVQPRCCSLNFALTDGRYTIATRFRNGYSEHPPALYYSTGSQFKCDNGHFVREPTDESGRIDAVVIASEPLTYDRTQWHLVPNYHILVVGPAANGHGKHFDSIPIMIGTTVDRCFQKWKQTALSGKNLKSYAHEKPCCGYTPGEIQHLKDVFSWASAFQHDQDSCRA